MPQVVGLGAWHVDPEQQPPVHILAHPLHAPPSHVSPWGHGPQMLPTLPHAEAMLPGWHVAPSQQPWGQELTSHTHKPPTQCWPAEHVGPVPQLHAPVELQPSLATGSQPGHAHAPAMHSWPGGQTCPAHAGPVRL
jgi:hypothetical protein